jgi:hypothetical protein
MAGDKETKDVVVALAKALRLAKPLLVDGAQWSDLMSLYQSIEADPAIAASMLEAVNGIAAVPVELSDLSFLEVFELVRAFLAEYNK